MGIFVRKLNSRIGEEGDPKKEVVPMTEDKVQRARSHAYDYFQAVDRAMRRQSITVQWKMSKSIGHRNIKSTT